MSRKYFNPYRINFDPNGFKRAGLAINGKMLKMRLKMNVYGFQIEHIPEHKSAFICFVRDQSHCSSPSCLRRLRFSE